jgi:hypothetical protein
MKDVFLALLERATTHQPKHAPLGDIFHLQQVQWIQSNGANAHSVLMEITVLETLHQERIAL